MNIKKIRRTIRIIYPIVGLSFMAWLLISVQARGIPDAVFQSDQFVLVEESDECLSFIPKNDTTDIGFIFYPGALVDPDAYAPMAKSLAVSGYVSCIIKIPNRIAFTGSQERKVEQRTVDLINNDSSKRWVLGGHSRGARMALDVVTRNESTLHGLVLLGTSHPREKDLSNLRLPIMKVYASSDGLASEEEVQRYANNLPDHTQWVLIEGGNHAQFAWYGKQLGDDRASITREDQQEQLIHAILQYFEML